MIKLIPNSWAKNLKDEFGKDYFQKLDSFLEEEYQNFQVYPPKEKVFEVLRLTPFEKTKVVIIGQDPYHGEGQAHGLAFSVAKGVKTPPSLRNIFKELNQDLNLPIPRHGNLEAWAKQGVLLLNAVLTVRKSEAASHRKIGWESFTDKIVERLSQDKEKLVFILWGRDAQKKGDKVDKNKHLVLECPHPSPFSAVKFYGNRHFSKANKFLKDNGIKEIDWRLASE
ncbi:MAG: uracil-DNA glycosylase [Bacteriovoracaceae bacterium]